MDHEQSESPARRAERAFGERVQRLRKVRGWSQEHLAKQMALYGFQMHPSVIAKMESATRPTPVGEVVALALILGVDTQDLVRLSANEGALAKVNETLFALQEVKAELREVNLTIEDLYKRRKSLRQERGRRLDSYRQACKAAGRSPTDQGNDDDVADTATPEVVHVQPKTYNDARLIGDHVRDGVPVLIDLTGTPDTEAKRLVDFAAGLTVALRGTIDRVAGISRLLLLIPADAVLNADIHVDEENNQVLIETPSTILRVQLHHGLEVHR